MAGFKFRYVISKAFLCLICLSFSGCFLDDEPKQWVGEITFVSDQYALWRRQGVYLNHEGPLIVEPLKFPLSRTRRFMGVSRQNVTKNAKAYKIAMESVLTNKYMLVDRPVKDGIMLRSFLSDGFRNPDLAEFADMLGALNEDPPKVRLIVEIIDINSRQLVGALCSLKKSEFFEAYLNAPRSEENMVVLYRSLAFDISPALAILNKNQYAAKISKEHHAF